MNDILMQLPFLEMTISGMLAYLIGSLSTAIIICRILKLPDPRTQGSNNPGATNVLRFAGKKVAAITLAGDAMKGFLPVLIIQFISDAAPVIAFTAFCAFLGHLYPIFFRFQGGKGVATALGCILALNPIVALCALVTWVIIFMATKLSSLAPLTAAIFCPFFLWTFNLMGLSQNSPYMIITVLLMDILLIIRHKENIKRLYLGSETGFRKK